MSARYWNWLKNHTYQYEMFNCQQVRLFNHINCMFIDRRFVCVQAELCPKHVEHCQAGGAPWLPYRVLKLMAQRLLLWRRRLRLMRMRTAVTIATDRVSLSRSLNLVSCCYSHHHHHHHHENVFSYVVFCSLLLCLSISTPFACVSTISIVCSVFLVSSDLPTYIWVKKGMSTVVRVHLDFLLRHLTYTALVFPDSPHCIRTG